VPNAVSVTELLVEFPPLTATVAVPPTVALPPTPVPVPLPPLPPPPPVATAFSDTVVVSVTVLAAPEYALPAVPPAPPAAPSAPVPPGPPAPPVHVAELEGSVLDAVSFSDIPFPPVPPGFVPFPPAVPAAPVTGPRVSAWLGIDQAVIAVASAIDIRAHRDRSRIDMNFSFPVGLY
jgi:homeobox protein ESX1